MKVLVADKISPKGVAWLKQQPGLDVVEAYGSSPAKLLELVKDVHAIAVRSETKITAEVIAAAPLLKVVGRAGVGVDNVDDLYPSALRSAPGAPGRRLNEGRSMGPEELFRHRTL